MIRYIMKKLDEFFYGRYVDKVMEEIIREHIENPVVMVNDRGEEYWVGYKK